MNKLIPIAILLSIAIYGQGWSASQPPPPRPLIGSQETQSPSKASNQESNDNKKDTEQFPVFVKILPTPESETAKQQITEQQEKESSRNRLIMWATIATALFNLVLAISTILMWRETEKAAVAAKKSANAALEAATANKLSTRAYVRISSCPPGIDFLTKKLPPYIELAANLEIKNYGETPAHITDIVIQAKLSEVDKLLPCPPDYSGAKRYPCSEAFLVRGASIFYKFFDDTMSPETITYIKEEKVILNLYGYVDYTDAFGKRHRGHFGQNYYPAYDKRENYRSDDEFKARNNLTFLMQSGYNYDCPRKEDEDKEKPIPTQQKHPADQR